MKALKSATKDVLETLKGRNYVSYDELLEILPGEFNDAETFDKLLASLGRCGIEVIDDPSAEDNSGAAQSRREREEEEMAIRKLNDPIRMYFSQMSEISLLTREQEIELAKGIESARDNLRRLIFMTRFGQCRAIDLLEMVLKKDLLIEKALDVNLSRKGERGEFFERLRRSVDVLKRNDDRSRADHDLLHSNGKRAD